MKMSKIHRCLFPESKRLAGRRPLRAFTLIELLSVVGLVAVLSALLFSAGQGMRQRSDRMRCISNLGQISVASISYSADHRGEWPENNVSGSGSNEVFMEQLFVYLPEIPKKPAADFLKSPFICPAEHSPEPDGAYLFKGVYVVRSRGLSYAQNSYLQATATNKRVGLRPGVQRPSELVLYMDFQSHYLLDADRLAKGETLARIKQRHGQMANAAFADGSVRQVDLDSIPTIFPSLFWQGRDH